MPFKESKEKIMTDIDKRQHTFKSEYKTTTQDLSLTLPIEIIFEDFRNLMQEWLCMYAMIHLPFLPTQLPEILMLSKVSSYTKMQLSSRMSLQITEYKREPS